MPIEKTLINDTSVAVKVTGEGQFFTAFRAKKNNYQFSCCNKPNFIAYFSMYMRAHHGLVYLHYQSIAEMCTTIVSNTYKEYLTIRVT